MEVKITLQDSGLERAFIVKGTQTPQHAQELGHSIVDIAYKWVQREAPRKTGRLKSRGMEKGYNANGGFVFASKARVSYIDWVIDGTRAHDIIPKRSQALSWPGAKHPVKRVRHPGTNSNPFVDRAFGTMQGEVDREIAKFEAWLEAV